MFQKMDVVCFLAEFFLPVLVCLCIFLCVNMFRSTTNAFGALTLLVGRQEGTGL